MSELRRSRASNKDPGMKIYVADEYFISDDSDEILNTEINVGQKNKENKPEKEETERTESIEEIKDDDIEGDKHSKVSIDDIVEINEEIDHFNIENDDDFF